jgi:hypothetical protein
MTRVYVGPLTDLVEEGWGYPQGAPLFVLPGNEESLELMAMRLNIDSINFRRTHVVPHFLLEPRMHARAIKEGAIQINVDGTKRAATLWRQHRNEQSLHKRANRAKNDSVERYG